MEMQTYKRILVGMDGSEQAVLAYKRAVGVAKRNNGRVIVAHVVENAMYNSMGYSTLNDRLIHQETAEVKEVLTECLEFAESVDFQQVDTVICYGSAKELLCKELPEKYTVDLIMMGQSGLNAVERLVMGSVSNYVIRHAPCDVLVVHPESVGK